MILLLVGESQVSHVLAKDINAVRVFAARRSASNLLDAGHHAQRSVDHNGGIFFGGWLRPEVQPIVGNGEYTARRSAVRANVGDVRFAGVNFFAGQILEGCIDL